jgi:hypothetical protein
MMLAYALPPELLNSRTQGHPPTRINEPTRNPTTLESFGAVRAVDNVNLEVFAVEGAFENITPDDWPLLRG